LLAALVDVVAIGAGGAEHSMLSRGLAALTVDDLHAIDARNQAIGIAQVVVLALAAIAFLRWLHRAHRNVVELGATDLRCGPGWAVGIWFVPIANLWRPKQVIDEVWRAIDPELAADVGNGWDN